MLLMLCGNENNSGGPHPFGETLFIDCQVYKGFLKVMDLIYKQINICANVGQG